MKKFYLVFETRGCEVLLKENLYAFEFSFLNSENISRSAMKMNLYKIHKRINSYKITKKTMVLVLLMFLQ